jgi:hypothetical protein
VKKNKWMRASVEGMEWEGTCRWMTGHGRSEQVRFKKGQLLGGNKKRKKGKI